MIGSGSNQMSSAASHRPGAFCPVRHETSGWPTWLSGSGSTEPGEQMPQLHPV